MERTDAIDWLNYRISASEGQFQVTDKDVAFIRNYVDHYKQTLVKTEDVIYSIQQNQHRLPEIFDFMINKLIETFDIKYEVADVQIPNAFGSFMGMDPNMKKVTKYT